MTISEKLYVKYNGVNLNDLGLLNGSVQGGLFTEPFLAQRTIKETVIRGRQPYFQSLEKSPSQFTLSFIFQDTWDDTKIRQIVQLFNVDYYYPLIFSLDGNFTGNEHILYAMPVDSPNIIHNGLKNGYITMNWRCDSEYAYSPIQSTQLYDYSTAGSGSFAFSNTGDVVIKPNIVVTVVSGGSFTLTNATNGNSISFTGLATNEILTLDCEKESITSSISAQTYRYSNMDAINKTFPQMELGINTINVTGNVKVQINYEFKYLNY